MKRIAAACPISRFLDHAPVAANRPAALLLQKKDMHRPATVFATTVQTPNCILAVMWERALIIRAANVAPTVYASKETVHVCRTRQNVPLFAVNKNLSS